jgi:predicted ATPase
VRFLAFNGDVVRDLASQFLALAAKQRMTAPPMIGHRIMGHSLLVSGDIAEARLHYDKGIALYNPAEHRPLAMRFGMDAWASILAYRSLGLWLLGYPEAALRDIDDLLNNARESGQAAATVMLASYHASLRHLSCGNYATANMHADELVCLADEKGALFWKMQGLMNRGCAAAFTENASGAVQMITSGCTAWRSTGSTLWTPSYLSVLAWSYAKLDRFAEAWRSISEAVTIIVTTKERWCEAEVNRMAGEIERMSPVSDAAKAEAYFERAVAVARAQQAKSWELRAAISMARLWRDQGKRDAARDLLAPVYGWFTEGFDSVDLKEAKALLDALA